MTQMNESRSRNRPTGIEANLWLLILPILFWIYMTVLLKLTEEKWLLDTFGEEYIKYCSKVNRVFPWFPKK